MDANLRYVYASPKVSELLGYAPEDLLGRTPYDLMPALEALRMRKEYEDLIQHPRSFQTLEITHLHKDGSLRTFETSGIPVIDRNGRFCGLRGIDRDISERKQVEQALQVALARSAQQQARSEAIIAAIGEGLIIVDRDYRVLYQNQILKDLAGESAEDHCYVLYGSQDKVCENCPVAQTFRDGGIHSIEKAVWQDGALVYREITASPLLDESGTIIAGIELVRDITERKRAEHALKESERQMKVVQRIANLGSWQLDRETGKVVWSDETYRILGLQPQQVPASRESFMEVVHPEDRDLVALRCGESVRDGSDGYEMEHRIVRQPGGEVRHIHQKCEHIRNESGRATQTYGMIHDITSRKEADERIRSLNADLSVRASELERVNKDLEAFSYTVSHDLRGPLTNINSYCQAIVELNGDRLDGQCTEFMQHVFEEVKGMDGLITSLLNLSRFAHVRLKSRKVNLSEIANIAAAELQIREPGRQVHFEIEQGVVVPGDERLLKMVVVNLFGNAWKFSAQKEDPAIRFGVTRWQGHPVYYVSDNGIGFKRSQSKLIFAVFQRLHRKDDFEGFGIGLTTVQRIIERHNGRIWAEGEPGKGAKFFFTLHEKPAEE